MFHVAIGLAAALFLPSVAAPQDASQAPPSQVEDVIVEGRRLSEIIERFVDDVVAPPVGRGPARWDRKICVGVINLHRDVAQILADQVSRIALDLELEPGDPGCRPNILVIATNDGEGMARALVETRPLAFRPRYGGAARSRSSLARFQAEDAPVRWWHVSLPMTEFGEPAVRLPGWERAPYVAEDATLLNTRLQNDLLLVWVIVDLAQIQGVNYQQLGDYIGMVAMAQIDPEAQTATYDTVLNLFDAPGGVSGLTDWDRSYLSALYDAELNRRAPNQQGGEIAGRMLQDRQRAQRDDAPD